MKVAVLLSGGVDSSVALAQLQQAGHDVTAFYLKIWLEDELSFLGECPWEDDLSFVRQVCDQFKVPLTVVPFQKEYKERIVAYTIDQVAHGFTPSPDVLCNRQIKFGAFFDYIAAHHAGEFDKIATGHYAQLFFDHDRSVYQLACSPDRVKDQSYFLSHLRQEQVARLLFPIGALQKEQVRQLALTYNLANKNRKDSQGICFLGKIKFADFVKFYLGEKPGNIVEYETGAVLGTHNGFWFHTIGQRKGLGLSGGPWYVVDKQSSTNTVLVSRAYDAVAHNRNRCRVAAINWIAGSHQFTGHGVTENFLVKIRHGPEMQPAQFVFDDATYQGGELVLPVADQGLAPGQFVVFYKKLIAAHTEYMVCLGSGVIAR